MTLEANTLPHRSQDHPVSPVCVFMWWHSEQVLLKLCRHSSQLVSPACTSGTSKGTSSCVALVAWTFLPASISFKMPFALFKSFFGTFIMPSSSRVGGSGGEGPAEGGLFNLLDMPRMSPIPSASSSELMPTASGSSVSSGCRDLYTEFSKGLQVRISFTSSLLARTRSRYTSDHLMYIASDRLQ